MKATKSEEQVGTYVVVGGLGGGGLGEVGHGRGQRSVEVEGANGGQWTPVRGRGGLKEGACAVVGGGRNWLRRVHG
jgi:hypothetical protein